MAARFSRARLLSLVLLAVCAAAACAALDKPSAAEAASDQALLAAVGAPTRGAENVARDGARHPAASLAFWGLKPGITFIEIWPAPGYWTEIVAPYLKSSGGHYIAAVPNLDRKLPEEFDDKSLYGDISYVAFNDKSGPLGPAISADLVLTARNIHDWMWTPGYAEKFMSDAFAVLKPGGILAVEDHRADPRPTNLAAHDGYVNTADIVAMAEKVGFKLEAKSEINANPKDTKDHPFGVWTLPPTRQSAPRGQPPNPNFDHSKYDAIGESDRMTLRFRKPG
jgi:predicted methyltransferase